MDFDRHTLFCYECNDYVYDTEIDERILRAELFSSKFFSFRSLLTTRSVINREHKKKNPKRRNKEFSIHHGNQQEKM